MGTRIDVYVADRELDFSCLVILRSTDASEVSYGYHLGRGVAAMTSLVGVVSNTLDVAGRKSALFTPAGNIGHDLGTNIFNRSYVYDAMDRLASDGNVSYAYDAADNRITKTGDVEGDGKIPGTDVPKEPHVHQYQRGGQGVTRRFNLDGTPQDGGRRIPSRDAAAFGCAVKDVMKYMPRMPLMIMVMPPSIQPNESGQ